MKKSLKRIFRRVGFSIQRSRSYGTDATEDTRKILGVQNIKTVFDVGANEGQTATHFLKEFPRATIFSFEPFTEAYEKLKNLPINDRFVPVNMALGEATSTKKLFLTKYSLTNSLLPVDSEATKFLGDCVEKSGEAVINVTTLDNFCSQRKIDRIDLLKLDTQGYELKVLEGAKHLLAAGAIRSILTEVNFVPLYEHQAYFHDVYQKLWDNGFRLVSLYNQEYRSGNYLNWCDALFVNLEAEPR